MSTVFASCLLKSRVEMKLTQEDLATRANTYASHISALENGKKVCGLKLAKRLAIALYPDSEDKRLLFLTVLVQTARA